MKLKKIFTLLFTLIFVSTATFADNAYLEIETLESKKQDLLSVRNGNPAQKSEILANAKNEYERASASIDDELLRIAETDADGNMLADVKKRRLDEKKELKTQIEQRAKEEIASLEGGDSSFEEQLLREIEQMEAELKQARSVDSFEDPRILSINTYAGDKYYWNSVIRFYLGNKQIFSQNVSLNYQNIAGKSPASITKSDEATYNDYLDTVDYYDELLKSNDGTIVAQINYVIQACDKSLPSTYRITINSIRIVNKDNNSVLQSITPVNSTYTFSMKPAVDIRKDSEKGIVSYTGNKTGIGTVQTGTTPTTGNKTVSEPKVVPTTSNAPSKAELMSKNTDGRFNLGVMLGTIPTYFDFDVSMENMGTIAAYFTIPVSSNFFFSMDMGEMPTPKAFGSYDNSEGYVFDITFGCGVNYRLPIKILSPNIYFSGAVGFAWGNTLEYIPYGYSYSYNNIENMLFVGKLSCGIDFTIAKLLVLTCDYSMWYVEDAGWAPNTSFGIAIDLN